MWTGRTAIKKECTACRESKEINEFSLDRSRPDGKAVWCRRCRGTHYAEYRSANKEKLNKRRREYWPANKEKLNKRQREYRLVANDTYIRRRLKNQFGLKGGDITEELINLKRAHLKLRRELFKIKKEKTA